MMLILNFIVQKEAANNMESINQDKVRLKQCKYLLKQALDIDESGKEDLAIDTYTQAIELSLKVVIKHVLFNKMSTHFCYVIKLIIKKSYLYESLHLK